MSSNRRLWYSCLTVIFRKQRSQQMVRSIFHRRRERRIWRLSFVEGFTRPWQSRIRSSNPASESFSRRPSTRHIDVSKLARSGTPKSVLASGRALHNGVNNADKTFPIVMTCSTSFVFGGTRRNQRSTLAHNRSNKSASFRGDGMTTSRLGCDADKSKINCYSEFWNSLHIHKKIKNQHSSLSTTVYYRYHGIDIFSSQYYIWLEVQKYDRWEQHSKGEFLTQIWRALEY